MKKLFVNQLVITIFAVSAAFTSCVNNGDEKGDNAAYLISGKFANLTGTGDAVFYADYVSGAKSATNEKELAGKIKDGDIIFNLQGVYDAVSKKFYLSAGSNMLVYQIVGTLSDGKMTNALSTIKVKSGDEWTVFTVYATSDDVSIDGNVSNIQTDGIPSSWFGNWMSIDATGAPRNYMMTAWQFIYLRMPEIPAGFLDIVSLDNGRLEMIWAMPVYKGYGEMEDHADECVMEFVKIWIEESEQGLLITDFHLSYSETYADAKAYDTSTPITYPEDKGEVILTRP